VRDRALVALFLGHGPRTVELHRANLGDVDLAAGELRLKGKVRDRTIFLRADVLAVVRQLVALRLADGGTSLTSDAPLFANAGRVNAGARLSRRGIRFALDRAFAVAGLVPRAMSRPRGDGATRPLRRAAIGKRAMHSPACACRVLTVYVRPTLRSRAPAGPSSNTSPTTSATRICGRRGNT